MPLTILIADNDLYSRSKLAAQLRETEAKVQETANGATALASIEEGAVDALVTEMTLHGLGGRELVRAVLTAFPGFPVFILVAKPVVDDAFHYARLGVLDYRGKDDVSGDYIEQLLQAAQGRSGEREGNRGPLNLPFSHYVSRNAEMATLYRTAIERVARAPSTVLIQGESGTGKELLARAIHHHSPRAKNPWVAVNCAALPENLIESELFGHEKGAFTGANSQRTGRFEQAEGGTFFLDEVGDLSPVVQTKLLRVIQERTIERVGGSRPIKVDVRLIAATHRDLKAMVASGDFREDLYYRLAVIRLELPPLRDRPEDILGLIHYFVDRYRQTVGRGPMVITPRAIEALQHHDWPGNVRELENVIERVVVLAPGDTIDLEDLGEEFGARPAGRVSAPSLREARAEFEQDYITRALVKREGNVSATADDLGIARKNLQEKIKRYEIDVDAIRDAAGEPPVT